MGFDDNGDLDTVSVRVAMVTWRLMGGWTPTTREVSEFLGMELSGAYYLMARISRVIPLYLDEIPAQQRFTSPSKWRIAPIDTVSIASCNNGNQEA